MPANSPFQVKEYLARSSESSLKAAAEDHVSRLHPQAESKGKAVIFHKSGTYPNGRKQWSYDVSELPDVIPLYAGLEDVYISQQRFHFGRKKENLKEIQSLYVDVDFHKIPEFAGMDARGVLADVLVALERARMPAPTLAIASGRGLYVIWLLSEAIPRAAIGRWNACQKELWKTLESFGADRGALDASRVLRLCGTVNSKSGKTVEQIAAPGEVWRFDDLANEILPYTREELYDLRIQRAARAARKPPKSRQRPSKGFTPSSMWETRLEDLQRLRQLRYPRTGGKLPSGERDTWLFIAGVTMSWFAEPRFLEAELSQLALQVASWDGAESQSRLQAIFKRVHMAARGETIEWRGERIDPRYRFKNQTIIELLEIEDWEMREMQVLISKDEKKRRRRERDEKSRREAGMMERSEYLGMASHNRREAVKLRSNGLKVREIAETLKLTERRVYKLLSDYVPNEHEQSTPLYGGGAPRRAVVEEKPRHLRGNEIEEKEFRGVHRESKSKVKSLPQKERPDYPESIPSGEEVEKASELRGERGASKSDLEDLPSKSHATGKSIPSGEEIAKELRPEQNAATLKVKSLPQRQRHDHPRSIPRGEEEDLPRGVGHDHPRSIPVAEDLRPRRAESEGHPLTCECLECSSTTPRYVRMA
jgi:hypothetical protein